AQGLQGLASARRQAHSHGLSSQVGLTRSLAELLTESLTYDTVASAGGGGGAASTTSPRRHVAQGAVIEPKSPSDSSFGPAVKKSVLVGPLLAAPCPNCKAQRPSIEIGCDAPSRSSPRCSNLPLAPSS